MTREIGRSTVRPFSSLERKTTTLPNGLPNVLVVSNEVPQTVYAGCILLYRLLRDYPSEKLVVIGPKTCPHAERLTCRYEELRLPFERLNVTRFAAMKRSLDACASFPRVPLAVIRNLQAAFTPEVILSVMEGGYSEVAARLARRTGQPLVLIVHDKQELFDRVYPWALRSQIRSNAAIYRTASRRLCVSPEMKQHLHDLYGEDGEVLYPNRSEDLVPRPLEYSLKLIEEPIFHIGYAGTLAYGYGTQLIRLAACLKETKIRLRLYGDVGPAHARLLNELRDVVACRGLVAPPERMWEMVKAECDAVILPYAWQDASTPLELYRTHFPSKLPEYLALGMPVIVMGPEYATGVRWALRNTDAVMAIIDDEPAKWLEAIEGLRASPERRINLARCAPVVGDRDFEPTSIREKFLNALRDVTKTLPGRDIRAPQLKRAIGSPI
jgi:glycosyltransferase involved in cell wall biosynthesis